MPQPGAQPWPLPKAMSAECSSSPDPCGGGPWRFPNAFETPGIGPKHELRPTSLFKDSAEGCGPTQVLWHKRQGRVCMIRNSCGAMVQKAILATLSTYQRGEIVPILSLHSTILLGWCPATWTVQHSKQVVLRCFCMRQANPTNSIPALWKQSLQHHPHKPGPQLTYVAFCWESFKTCCRTVEHSSTPNAYTILTTWRGRSRYALRSGNSRNSFDNCYVTLDTGGYCSRNSQ